MEHEGTKNIEAAAPPPLHEGVQILASAGGEVVGVRTATTAGLEHLNGAVALGLAERSLIENLFVCPGCDSTAVQVLERCSRCRSIDLETEALTHHLPCGGVSRALTENGSTNGACSKCGLRLSDRPEEFEDAGFMYRCNGCGGEDAEPKVSFSCTRCGRETAGDQMPKRRTYRYRLSERGQALLNPGTR